MRRRKRRVLEELGRGERYVLDLFRVVSYPTIFRLHQDLAQLEDRGLVTYREVPGGPERGGRPRRLYRLV